MKTTLVLSLLTAASASCIRGTHLQPRGVNVDVFSFNYTGVGGPLNWYGLDRVANKACDLGHHQSPVDITADFDPAAPGTLKFDIPTIEHAEFENLGCGLEVVLAEGNIATADGRNYNLAQFHFHTPGEHRVNEEYFPLEAHFVFSDADKNIAVVGFLFQLSEDGSSMPLFDSVFANLDEISEPGSTTETGPLDFGELKQHLESQGHYEYSGSLTTPPCLEGVTWFVSKKPLPLDVATYNRIKGILKFNARYIQNTLGEENLLEIVARELASL